MALTALIMSGLTNAAKDLLVFFASQAAINT